MMRVASCSDDISSEKKPTMPPSSTLDRSVGLMLGAIGLGDVIGDVGGERRLAHRRAAGEDDEVGGLQAAHLLVEILEAGGNARKAAVALVGVGRHVDRIGERPAEGLEALAVFARLGDLVEALLGLLDQVARGRIDRRVIGDVDDIAADADELAPLRELVDRAAIFLGVDDRGRRGREAREIDRRRRFPSASRRARNRS